MPEQGIDTCFAVVTIPISLLLSSKAYQQDYRVFLIHYYFLVEAASFQCMALVVTIAFYNLHSCKSIICILGIRLPKTVGLVSQKIYLDLHWEYTMVWIQNGIRLFVWLNVTFLLFWSQFLGSPNKSFPKTRNFPLSFLGVWSGAAHREHCHI